MRRDDLVSFTEAAALVGVCDRTLRNWFAAGLVNVVRVGPKRVYLTREEVARLSAGKTDRAREAK